MQNIKQGETTRQNILLSSSVCPDLFLFIFLFFNFKLCNLQNNNKSQQHSNWTSVGNGLACLLATVCQLHFWKSSDPGAAFRNALYGFQAIYKISKIISGATTSRLSTSESIWAGGMCQQHSCDIQQGPMWTPGQVWGQSCKNVGWGQLGLLKIWANVWKFSRTPWAGRGGSSGCARRGWMTKAVLREFSVELEPGSTQCWNRRVWDQAQGEGFSPLEQLGRLCWLWPWGFSSPHGCSPEQPGLDSALSLLQ